MTPCSTHCAAALMGLACALPALGQTSAPAVDAPDPGLVETRPAPLPVPVPVDPPAPADSSRWRFQLGAALVSQPSYLGSDQRKTQLRPVFSLQYGRLRLSSSRASLIEGPSDGRAPAGASLALNDRGPWAMTVALRLDNGRSASDDPHFAGLPDVRATLRGRINLRYSFTESLSAGLSLSPDLLNRAGGTYGSLDLAWRHALSPALRWTVGGGLGLADATYQRSQFGVTPAAALTSGLPAYRPGAGTLGVGLGTGLVWRAAPRWRLAVTGGLGWLTGPAVDSPLTHQRASWNLSLGAVWISPEP
jgi:MipA family protein